MADEQVRSGLLVRACMEALGDADRPLPPAEAIARTKERVGQFTPYELGVLKEGVVRWENALRWQTGSVATVGWMSKTGGWQITDSGRDALERYPDPVELLKTAQRLYRQTYRDRKLAVAQLAPVEQHIVSALGALGPGQWTSHGDLAEIADTDPLTVANFLAGQRVPGAVRVLRDDGTPPPEGMLNAWLRGINVVKELAGEGVEFDAMGHASQKNRVTADELRAHLDDLADPEPDEPRQQSAWLVRGAVDGVDLVPGWVTDSVVSVAASRLPLTFDVASRPAEIESAVKAVYDFKTYTQVDRLVKELTAFLRQIREGDYVTTVDHGQLLIGVVAGDADLVDSPGGLSNLRRPVQWLNPGNPVDYTDLGDQFANKLGDQAQVVNLTDVLPLIEAQAARIRHEPVAVRAPEARFAEVTNALAGELLVHDRRWLQDLADLLAERRQIVLYGPPGTGKTYLARRLARHLAGEQAVKLVQFHPSYTYEDFFEGYRPEATGGQLSFKLRSGPLRDLADAARDDPYTAYILVIDEINRANLAKVFGELYFLLEYRDESIGLQYSPNDKFSLPKNLYVIGTMNTADRSIALVDAAMRRRFAFIEMHPRVEPVRGLLLRWLAKHGYAEEASQLLDALNARLVDRDYAIGPSYLMNEATYTRPDGLDRVWRTSILPLLEELHYGEGVDVEAECGLAALRASLGAEPQVPSGTPEPAEP